MKLLNNAVKGAMLSGMIFPGLGQIILKYYKRGITLTLITIFCLTIIIIKVTQQVITILEKIQVNESSIDITMLSEIVANTSSSFDGTLFNILTFLIIACWIYGTVDAYMIGKKKDKTEVCK